MRAGREGRRPSIFVAAGSLTITNVIKNRFIMDNNIRSITVFPFGVGHDDFSPKSLDDVVYSLPVVP